ncbi:MAG: ABC transporter substrate-binding protein [Treponema sp.]|jgi:ABC-type glycerol-3-phosphate transport system substrate-binding protein|nr:ABC transporter substrate-binding protein [Treponema sp.]
MRKLIVLSIIIALVLGSCSFFQRFFRHETAILWTDQPELAVYAEQFNLMQDQYKIEIKYMEQPAAQLVSTSEYPDIIVGNWLKSSSTRTFFLGLDTLFNNDQIRQNAFYPALLNLGRIDDIQYLLPVSFNIPVAVFSAEHQDMVSNPFTITLDEMKELGKNYNVQKDGVYSAMGFSPSANDEFSFVVSTLFNTSFREGNPLAWDPIALERSVENLKTWTKEANSNIQSEGDFVFKYFYDPPAKLILSGRILFSYLTSYDFFTMGEETRSQLAFRYISHNNVIPVDERMIYMGIIKKGKAREAAKKFVEWFYQDETQRKLLAYTRQNRLSDKLFGIGNGFSALRTVTESVFPQFYPNLLGHIPPANYLSPPNILPRNWMTIKEQVILPYLHERIRNEDRESIKTLEQRISDWYKLNPIR